MLFMVMPLARIEWPTRIHAPFGNAQISRALKPALCDAVQMHLTPAFYDVRHVLKISPEGGVHHV